MVSLGYHISTESLTLMLANVLHWSIQEVGKNCHLICHIANFEPICGGICTTVGGDYFSLLGSARVKN